MKSLMVRTQLWMAGLFMPLFAWAQEPETVAGAGSMLKPIWDAIGNGSYLLAGAGITLILVFVFRKYVMDKIGLGSGVLPLVSAVLGVISGLAVSVWGGANGGEAAMAMLSGPAAGMLWDAVFKYFFKKE
jgi:hypothetical protein